MTTITQEALERAVTAVCAQWNMHRPDARRMLECALPELLAAQPASSPGGQKPVAWQWKLKTDASDEWVTRHKDRIRAMQHQQKESGDHG